MGVQDHIEDGFNVTADLTTMLEQAFSSNAAKPGSVEYPNYLRFQSIVEHFKTNLCDLQALVDKHNQEAADCIFAQDTARRDIWIDEKDSWRVLFTNLVAEEENMHRVHFLKEEMSQMRELCDNELQKELLIHDKEIMLESKHLLERGVLENHEALDRDGILHEDHSKHFAIFFAAVRNEYATATECDLNQEEYRAFKVIKAIVETEQEDIISAGLNHFCELPWGILRHLFCCDINTVESLQEHSHDAVKLLRLGFDDDQRAAIISLATAAKEASFYSEIAAKNHENALLKAQLAALMKNQEHEHNKNHNSNVRSSISCGGNTDDDQHDDQDDDTAGNLDTMPAGNGGNPLYNFFTSAFSSPRSLNGAATALTDDGIVQRADTPCPNNNKSNSDFTMVEEAAECDDQQQGLNNKTTVKNQTTNTTSGSQRDDAGDVVA